MGSAPSSHVLAVFPKGSVGLRGSPGGRPSPASWALYLGSLLTGVRVHRQNVIAGVSLTADVTGAVL